MTEARKTIVEWCKEYEAVIVNANGFPKPFSWDSEVTRNEFLQGMMGSTIQFTPKIVEALIEFTQSN